MTADERQQLEDGLGQLEELAATNARQSAALFEMLQKVSATLTAHRQVIDLLRGTMGPPTPKPPTPSSTVN